MGDSIFHSFEKSVVLQTIDIGWREHLAALDHLRQGIHLRGYAQKILNRSTNEKPFSCLKVSWKMLEMKLPQSL